MRVEALLRLVAGAALVANAPLLAAQSTPPPSLEALDAGFVCPESLPSDAARTTALRSFFDDYARLRPEATPSDIIFYRRLLLGKHHCAQTLAHLEAADTAVTADNVREQAWIPIQEHDGVSLAMSSSHLAPVLDPRFPNDKAVEAFARVTLRAPTVTNATHIRYDEVVSHEIFFCRANRYALVENDYYLAGRKVLADPSPAIQHTTEGRDLYALKDIPPGSPNAAAAAWACATSHATAS